MACACDPETGTSCLFHFDLDGYILGQALAAEPDPAADEEDD